MFDSLRQSFQACQLCATFSSSFAAFEFASASSSELDATVSASWPFGSTAGASWGLEQSCPGSSHLEVHAMKLPAKLSLLRFLSCGPFSAIVSSFNASSSASSSFVGSEFASLATCESHPSFSLFSS